MNRSEAASALADLLTGFPGIDPIVQWDLLDGKIALWARLAELARLPNGLLIASPNPAASAHHYRDLFERQLPLQGGLSLNEGDVVLDACAGYGLRALWLQQGHKHLRLHCAEADPELRALFRTNMALYALDPSVAAQAHPSDLPEERLDLVLLANPDAALAWLSDLAPTDWMRLKQLLVALEGRDLTGSPLTALLEGHGFHVFSAHDQLYARHKSRAEARPPEGEQPWQRQLKPLGRDRVAVADWLSQRLAELPREHPLHNADFYLTLVEHWPMTPQGTVNRASLPLPDPLTPLPNTTGAWARELDLHVISLTPHR